MFFEQFPEFVSEDVRKVRQLVPVTTETLNKRCAVMLPESLITDKSVLDLGSALGAMGHWALCHKARSYTGVEIQKNYLDKSTELFKKYHADEQWNFIRDIDTEKRYDVVVAAGFIHGFFDVFDILKKICQLSLGVVVIETNATEDSTHPSITFGNGTMVKASNVVYDHNAGIITLPNQSALDLIMKINGFEFVERLYPEKFTTGHDAYNYQSTPTVFDRVILKYKKAKATLTLEDAIRNDNLEI
jgi:hypothetical protein